MRHTTCISENVLGVDTDLRAPLVVALATFTLPCARRLPRSYRAG